MRFISKYNVLNALSKYTYFNMSKNITKYTFFLIFKSSTAFSVNFKITDHKYQYWMLKTIAFFTDIGWSVKEMRSQATLSTKNLENISKFEGWGLILVSYKKASVLNNMFSGCIQIWKNVILHEIINEQNMNTLHHQLYTNWEY